MKDASGPRAAEVASTLVAFLRDPAHHRPAYLHGERAMPDGSIVLKLALDRVVPAWHRHIDGFDRAELVEAAQAFVRQVCLWERASHYQVLCVERGAATEAIRENYRLLMALLHPDRQKGSGEWPTGCAQRVNEAYAVLSDAGARAGYDRDTRVAHVSAPFEGVHPGRVASRRRTRDFVRPFFLVTGVVAAIFVVQAWWVGSVPQHYAVLERSAPRSNSSAWVRDISESLPRFLGITRPTFETLQPLSPARPEARLAAWVPTIDRPKASLVTAADTPVLPATAPPIPAAPAAIAAAAPPPIEAPPRTIVAQASSPPSKAAPAAAAAASSLGTQDIELLVARLVSYYEQGDADGMMALFASGEPGFWKGMRTRAAYQDFFRATRQRRLRMDQLQWRSAADLAQARGSATVIADYVDGARHVEQKVDVEIDIALRDGRAGITRLSLFPDGAK
jgi:hypothetical protein